MIAEATTVDMSDGACAVIRTNAGEWGRFPAEGDLAAPLDRFEVNNQPGENFILKLNPAPGGRPIEISKCNILSGQNKNKQGYQWVLSNSVGP